MIEQNITISHHRWKLESVVNILGFSLFLSAIIAACCIGFFTKTLITIENPAILILASFFVLVPFRLGTLTTLQKIICFYLFGILINQLSIQYFPVSISSANINISYSIVPLLLCGLGYFITNGLGYSAEVNSTSIPRAIESKNVFCAWIMTFVIIIVHIIFLSLVLSKFYGYGYERNLSTAGNLMLYLLLFILLWEKLSSLRFRRSIGKVLALFYLISIFCK